MRNKMNIVSILITVLIALTASLNMIDFPVELRFEETKYNYLFVSTLCLLLPISVFLTALTFKNRKYTYFCIALSFSLAVPSALVYFFANSDYKSISQEGIDHSFQQINEIQTNGSTYRLYRTNGGATTSFGLVLRKETNFIKGINTVKVIFSKYKASDSTLLLLNGNTIQMQIEPYSKDDKLEAVTLTI